MELDPNAAKPERKAADNQRHDAAIETLRGLAIVLLVAYHSQGHDPAAGHLNVAFSSRNDNLHVIMGSFLMPLFAAIAGFVYAMRPVVRGDVKSFLVHKCRRLLLPFFSAVTLTYLLRAFAPGITHRADPTQIWRAYLFTYEHFWFLQSLFLIFLMMALLELAGLISQPWHWLLCFIAGLILSRCAPGSDVFSIWGAFYLFPFFVLGCVLNRYARQLSGSRLAWAAGLMALSGLALLCVGHRESTFARTDPLGIWIGLGAGFLFLRSRRPVPLLAVLGTYSYAIFLYHGFALAIAQRLFLSLHVCSPNLAFFTKWSCGLSLPVLAEVVIRKNALARRVLLGQ